MWNLYYMSTLSREQTEKLDFRAAAFGNLGQNHRKGCIWVKAKSAIYSAAFPWCPLNRTSLSMIDNSHPALDFSLQSEVSEHKAHFPVSLNAVWGGPLPTSHTHSWAGPDGSISLSKFNQSFQQLPGDRPKRTTRPQIKGEPRGASYCSAAEEMYCCWLWNAKEERDVFTWWHCVYPSKAEV